MVLKARRRHVWRSPRTQRRSAALCAAQSADQRLQLLNPTRSSWLSSAMRARSPCASTSEPSAHVLKASRAMSPPRVPRLRSTPPMRDFDCALSRAISHQLCSARRRWSWMTEITAASIARHTRVISRQWNQAGRGPPRRHEPSASFSRRVYCSCAIALTLKPLKPWRSLADRSADRQRRTVPRCSEAALAPAPHQRHQRAVARLPHAPAFHPRVERRTDRLARVQARRARAEPEASQCAPDRASLVLVRFQEIDPRHPDAALPQAAQRAHGRGDQSPVDRERAPLEPCLAQPDALPIG
eukprot:121280-Prymnesium_polylepis.2